MCPALAVCGNITRCEKNAKQVLLQIRYNRSSFSPFPSLPNILTLRMWWEFMHLGPCERVKASIWKPMKHWMSVTTDAQSTLYGRDSKPLMTRRWRRTIIIPPIEFPANTTGSMTTSTMSSRTCSAQVSYAYVMLGLGFRPKHQRECSSHYLVFHSSSATALTTAKECNL